MGRNVKAALIVLYVLQLVVVFRTQLGNLYAFAVQSVRHETTSHDERPRVRQTHTGVLLLAASSLSGLHATHVEHEHVHPPHDGHHDFDVKTTKARRRRERASWGIFLYDLKAAIAVIAPHRSTFRALPRLSSCLRQPA